MNPLALGGIVQAVGQLADDLITTDKERLDAELELRRLGLEERKVEADLVRGQLDVNRAEAASSSLFVAGWRPAIGWIGAAALLHLGIRPDDYRELMRLERPTLAETAVMAGFATLIIRTRVKEG